jgi:hypothetical protein
MVLRFAVLAAVAHCLLVGRPTAAVELTAENFEDLVVTPEKNAFVLYAPWPPPHSLSACSPSATQVLA